LTLLGATFCSSPSRIAKRCRPIAAGSRALRVRLPPREWPRTELSTSGRPRRRIHPPPRRNRYARHYAECVCGLEDAEGMEIRERRYQPRFCDTKWAFRVTPRARRYVMGNESRSLSRFRGFAPRKPGFHIRSNPRRGTPRARRLRGSVPPRDPSTVRRSATLRSQC
jgi:hypothetical protein